MYVVHMLMKNTCTFDVFLNVFQRLTFQNKSSGDLQANSRVKDFFAIVCDELASLALAKVTVSKRKKENTRFGVGNCNQGC